VRKRVFYSSFLILLICFASCKRKEFLFEEISSSHSNIDFNNLITENDSINALDLVNVYTGGGIGVGDFNNDGLQDIYFSGNMVPGKLYLNRGDFEFEDVTDKAEIDVQGRWGKGVSVIDINNDGLMDFYLCNSVSNDPQKRRNLLFVNKGLDKNKVPQFKESAEEYGLDISLYSNMGNFFDYDNDGDLDMYLGVYEPIPSEYPNNFRPSIKDGTHPSTGKLFENNQSTTLKHPVFTDVSTKAGITIEGYGLGATIADLNRDGWKDIYVSNDFLSSNILYINNQNGTFTDRTQEYFKHTSYNAMGQDIVDINNDGLADVVELDMNPEDNYRKKMMMMANSYQTIQNFEHYNYQFQYVRNTLQLNQGPRVGENDSIKAPAFSEIGFMAGMAQTDWSWAPVITDFNNDGLRDMIITNGYPKDITDHDFMVFRNQPYLTASKKQILDQIPAVKIHNYAYQNTGELSFTDVSNKWGLSIPSFSAGAVYADLNNDGALDLIISNINDKALVYKNKGAGNKANRLNYLQVKFKGDKSNINGLGAWADIYYQGKHQVYEHSPYRGYLSSMQDIAHFGLDNVDRIDSLVIKWPNGRKQVLKQIKSNQTIEVATINALENYTWNAEKSTTKSLFVNVTSSLGVKYKHKEEDFVDFNIQKLLPHKFSEYSPALAAGDIDKNGLDDILIGGNSESPAQVLYQQNNGKFLQKDVFKTLTAGKTKDEGILLIDVNNDNALDVFVASGGYEEATNSKSYQDRLFINDGKGNFKIATDALPENLTSKLCARAFDYNRDGKLDLFLAGRVNPWNYPKPVSSYIYRNDSKNGSIKFTDVTAQVAPELKNIGLVCDALFTDFDNDTWPDLILAGEWMPVTFLKNTNGKFKNVTSSSGVADKFGWWNTIAAGDFRHTGKIDYIVGNVGLNTLFKADEQYPVYITAKDFDNRPGRFDAFPSLYLPDQNGEKKEYPMHLRDDANKQMISLRQRFTNYKSYANATMDDIFTPEQRKGALRLKANELQTCYFRNEGGGKFTCIPLPKMVQISVINGMQVEDFDGDSNLDVAINGNDYGTDVSIGRYDAFNGLILKGDGKGGFTPLSILQSGLYIPGNGKALVKLRDNKGNYLLAASQNREALKLFKLKRPLQNVPLRPDDQSAIIRYKNGKTTKQEFYYGSSFLSQSARFIPISKGISGITITNQKGSKREVFFN
jgi:hypothetical protein